MGLTHTYLPKTIQIEMCISIKKEYFKSLPPFHCGCGRKREKSQLNGEEENSEQMNRNKTRSYFVCLFVFVLNEFYWPQK